MGHPKAPPPVPHLDLSEEDPVASARGVGPPSVGELLELIRWLLIEGADHPTWGLERRVNAAFGEVLEYLSRLLHHGPEHE